MQDVYYVSCYVYSERIISLRYAVMEDYTVYRHGFCQLFTTAFILFSNSKCVVSFSLGAVA